MSETPTSPNHVSLVESFDAYVKEQINDKGDNAHLRELVEFFNESLSIVDDLDTVNQLLVEAGRQDLTIKDRAAMMVITDPLEIPLICNNFTFGFRFIKDRVSTGEQDIFGNEKTKVVAPSASEILELRQLPKIGTFEEFAELFKQPHKFAALGKLNNFLPNHATRASFTRMLNLFPEFTSGLASKVSSVDVYTYNPEYTDDLYVAYQLMSQLVDSKDKYVQNDDGQVDDWYLCR